MPPDMPTAWSRDDTGRLRTRPPPPAVTPAATAPTPKPAASRGRRRRPLQEQRADNDDHEEGWLDGSSQLQRELDATVAAQTQQEDPTPSSSSSSVSSSDSGSAESTNSSSSFWRRYWKRKYGYCAAACATALLAWGLFNTNTVPEVALSPPCQVDSNPNNIFPCAMFPDLNRLLRSKDLDAWKRIYLPPNPYSGFRYPDHLAERPTGFAWDLKHEREHFVNARQYTASRVLRELDEGFNDLRVTEWCSVQSSFTLFFTSLFKPDREPDDRYLDWWTSLCRGKRINARYAYVTNLFPRTDGMEEYHLMAKAETLSEDMSRLTTRLSEKLSTTLYPPWRVIESANALYASINQTHADFNAWINIIALEERTSSPNLRHRLPLPSLLDPLRAYVLAMTVIRATTECWIIGQESVIEIQAKQLDRLRETAQRWQDRTSTFRLYREEQQQQHGSLWGWVLAMGRWYVHKPPTYSETVSLAWEDYHTWMTALDDFWIDYNVTRAAQGRCHVQWVASMEGTGVCVPRGTHVKLQKEDPEEQARTKNNKTNSEQLDEQTEEDEARQFDFYGWGCLDHKDPVWWEWFNGVPVCPLFRGIHGRYYEEDKRCALSRDERAWTNHAGLGKQRRGSAKENERVRPDGGGIAVILEEDTPMWEGRVHMERVNVTIRNGTVG